MVWLILLTDCRNPAFGTSSFVSTIVQTSVGGLRKEILTSFRSNGLIVEYGLSEGICIICAEP